MRFLTKDRVELAKHSALCYPQDAVEIRATLKCLQHSFCAYTEGRLHGLQPPDIEHFDPRLKGTAADGIGNWHAVIHCINNRKPRKIDPFLPLPDPNDPALRNRIVYRDGLFEAVDDDDLEIERLIRWIGANRPEVYEERKRHVGRLRFKLDTDGMPALIIYLRAHPEELQFATAMEVELQVPVDDLIGADPAD